MSWRTSPVQSPSRCNSSARCTAAGPKAASTHARATRSNRRTASDMSNPENKDEILARKWLVSLAGDSRSVRRSEHEPPDYVLNGKIAVEVTRISEGDETSLHSLGRIAKDALKDLGPPGHGRSLAVFWVYEPSRCFPKARAMKRQIRNALMPYTEQRADPEKLRDLSLGGSADVSLPCGFSLRLAHFLPTEEGPIFKFVHHFSGWTEEHIRERLLEGFKRAVRKKSDDVRDRARHRGPWWLVLVDHVFSTESFTFEGTNEGKRLQRDLRSLTHELARTEGTSWPWSRIVALAPHDPCNVHVLFDADG